MLAISTMISAQNFSLNSGQEMANAWVTVIVGLVVVGFPLFALLFLKKRIDRLEEKEIKDRFESLYENVETTVKYAYLISPLFIARRLVYAASIVFLNGCTLAQLTIQIAQSVFMLCYIVSVRPLKDNFSNRMEIFNEVTVLICSYILFTFTACVQDVQTRFEYGWIFIGVTLGNIIVNFIALFYKVGLGLRIAIIKLYRRFKRWRSKKGLENTSPLPITSTLGTVKINIESLEATHKIPLQ